MARTDNFKNFATDVADSIRSMTGKSDPIPASQFDTEIKSIETKEDLDVELNTYSTEVSAQEVSIDTIIDTLQGKATGNSSQEVFSTEEVITNKVWINGKPIYRKVFTGNLPTITNGTFGTLSFDISNLNLDSGVDWYGVVVQNNTEKTKWSLDWCNFQTSRSGITSISGGLFRVQSNTSDLSNATVHVVLEYTKTTDTAATTVEEG